MVVSDGKQLQAGGDQDFVSDTGTQRQALPRGHHDPTARPDIIRNKHSMIRIDVPLTFFPTPPLTEDKTPIHGVPYIVQMSTQDNWRVGRCLRKPLPFETVFRRTRVASGKSLPLCPGVWVHDKTYTVSIYVPEDPKTPHPRFILGR